MGRRCSLETRLGLLASLAFFSCSNADITVGETKVYLRKVSPWSDIVNGLKKMQSVTPRTDEVFDVHLYLYPAPEELKKGDLVCWYEPLDGIIRAYVTGNFLHESCIPHEIWQHRWPHIWVKHPNRHCNETSHKDPNSWECRDDAMWAWEEQRFKILAWPEIYP